MTTTTTENRRDYRLGSDLTNTRGLDEALTAAGLNWNTRLIEAKDFSIPMDDGFLITTIPGDRFVVREDTGITLGTVGNKYHAVSNANAFGLAQAWLDNGAIAVAGGVIEYGRRTFMDFDFPQHRIGLAGGKDLVTFGGRIIANHNGSGRVVAKAIGRRLWCMNGCTVDIKGLAHEFRVSHTASASDRIQQGYTILAETAQYVGAFADVAERMVATPMDRAGFTRYIDTVFPHPQVEAQRTGKAVTKNALTSWENRRAELLALWEFSSTNVPASGYTRWAGFNAVTEYLDWSSQVRVGNADDLQEARALRHFDDVNHDLRTAAFVLAA